MERSCKEVIVAFDPTLCLLVLRIFSGEKKAESQDARFLRHPIPLEFQAINHQFIRIGSFYPYTSLIELSPGRL
jgi:hypothetical protein